MCVCVCVCIYIFKITVKVNSFHSYISSCHAISMDISDPVLPPFSIVHRSKQVFRATSGISTELLYVVSSWLSCLFSSMCTSLMSLFLLLQQCPACLVRLTLIVFVMGGKWPYSCCLVGCCLYDLFNIACSILV